MAKKQVKLKKKGSVKAGTTKPRNIGGIFNAKVIAIVNSLKNKK
jgi:hypothetical protein